MSLLHWIEIRDQTKHTLFITLSTKNGWVNWIIIFESHVTQLTKPGNKELLWSISYDSTIKYLQYI